MPELYAPTAFARLVDEPWNDDRVRDAIAAIVARVDDGYRGRKLMWRPNEWDGWHGTSPMKNLYVGVAGVVWGLDALYRRGFAGSRLDLADVAMQNLENFRERPDYMKGMKLPKQRDSSLLCGEAGVLLVTWRLNHEATLADALHARVRENVDSDVDEIMWGSPGTLLAAHAMFHATHEQRWRDAWDESAKALLARRGEDGLWTQRLYGQEIKSLTPPHGVVGNVQSLAPLLDGPELGQVQRETNAVLARTAVRDDGFANWPPRDRPTLPGPDGQIRLQWCAGAPGIVHAAGDYLEEDLLLAGAELIWHAGPHGDEKGPGICHGTAGNGYAFLKAFKRTGDERWLDRARRFAIHALAQTQRRDARYSLWTGDVGVAIYASDCLAATSEYPIIETLD